MREHGLKVKDFVSLFHLEVLNQGSDFDSALLTVPDLNRPGLQFLSFYDYFDPCRLQVIGKAEVTYLRGYPRPGHCPESGLLSGVSGERR